MTAEPHAPPAEQIGRAEVERWVEKGQLDKALRGYRAVHERDPDDDRVAARIAELLVQRATRDRERGRDQSAADDLRQAVELWQRLGRIGLARRAARQLMAIDPAAAGLSSALRRQWWLGNARDFGLAALSAGLMLAAMPSLDLWPLALVGLLPILIAIRRATPGRAFLLGWTCGLVLNLGGNWWGVGLLEQFAHLSPNTGAVGVIAMCAYQALVFGLWAAGVRWLEGWLRLSPLVTAPLFMALWEAVIPFVFPWYLALAVWRAWPLCQVAELGGPPAVSALVVLFNLVVLRAGGALAGRQRPDRSAVAAAAVLVGLVALGGARAAQVAAARADAPALRVGLVQPNFGILSMELREKRGQKYIQVLREATEQAGEQGAELVVWPESMFPFLFDRGLDREYAKGHPWELRGRYQGRLLAGVLAHPFGEAYIYNSAVLFGADGGVRGIYDKNSLLVFGEYIPFRDRFPDWAERMRAKLPDWPEIEPGRGPSVLVDGDLRIGPLLCYEDILPGYVHQMVRQGDPNLLVTLANHAWFGTSLAPRQSMALAMFRGIETRRDLVRATNTGVSSVTDALGRVVTRGELRGVPRDQPKPAEVFVARVRLLSTFALGPYAAPVFPYACAAALLALALWAWRRRRRS